MPKRSLVQFFYRRKYIRRSFFAQKLAQLSSHVPPVLKMQLMIKVTTRLMAFLPLLNQALTIVGQARLAQFGPLGTAAAGTGLGWPDLSS